MRIEKRTTVLLLALVVLAAFAIPTTLADGNKKVNMTEGGGKINSTVMPNVSTFAFEAKNMSDKKGWKVEGNLQYNDHGAMIKLQGNVTMLMVDKTVTPHTATFSGWAKVTNATGAKMMLPYTVMVMEGKKGVGTFSISLPAAPPFLPAVYSDNDTLLGGHIKVDP